MKKTPDIVLEEDAPGVRKNNTCGLFEDFKLEGNIDFPEPMKANKYFPGEKVWAYSFLEAQWFESIVINQGGIYTVNVFSEDYRVARHMISDGKFSSTHVRLTRPPKIHEILSH